MRQLHRSLAVLIMFVGVWIGTTGVMMQSLDLHALLSHAPPTDPTIFSIREGRDGPPNFQVLVNSDYAAPALPGGFDFDAALAKVVPAARAVANGASLRFVEFRMGDGKPVGIVASNGKLLRFDALTGAVIAGPDTAPKWMLPPGGGGNSLRPTLKGIHRLAGFGDGWAPVFTLLALLLLTMIVSGIVMYFRLLKARARMGKKQPFWSAGGLLRTFHRGLSISAALFLLVVVTTGILCSMATLGVAWYRLQNNGLRPGVTQDVSAPLSDAELPGMLHTTLKSFRVADPTDPIKVLRLRYFATLAQGVVVAGNDVDSRQFAFNTATGRKAALQGPTYPTTGQTWGWQNVQIIKSIHRGDFFGIPGRFISLLTGLSLIFLSLSGGAMYFDLWNKRRKAGRRGLFWK